MSKRNQARREELIRGMQGLAAHPLAPKPSPAKRGSSWNRFDIGLFAGIALAALGMFLLH